MTSSGYLERYFDPELKVEAGSREELEAKEIERLKRALAVIVVAGAIPRRLGGDADYDTMAKDRRRARRAAHALKSALGGWVKKIPQLPLDDEIRVEGAQLDWDAFRDAHLTGVNERLRCVATWAVTNSEHRWGRSAVVRLENEINWLTYALRD